MATSHKMIRKMLYTLPIERESNSIIRVVRWMCSPRQNPITSEDIDIFMRTTDVTKMEHLEKTLIELGYTY